VKYISFSFKRLICICTFLTLSGCGIFGGSPEPITMELTITASEKLNPDIENRASPIVIRIYQLTHIDSFNNSDFFALYENDQSILAKDLKYREEMEIKPSLISSKSLEINPNSKYIAVLAAFRDLDKAQWKSILKIDPLNLQSLKLNLGEFDVTLGVNEEQ